MALFTLCWMEESEEKEKQGRRGKMNGKVAARRGKMAKARGEFSRMGEGFRVVFLQHRYQSQSFTGRVNVTGT